MRLEIMSYSNTPSITLIALRRGGRVIEDDGELLRVVCCHDHVFGILHEQLRRGEWCRRCYVSVGEERIRAYLLTTDYVFHQERRFPEELRFMKPLRLDFYIPKLRLVIEFDGKHHFYNKQNRSASLLLYVLERDIVKNKWCRDTNRNLVRIPFWRLSEATDIVAEAILRCDRGESVWRDEVEAWRYDCAKSIRERGEILTISIPIS